MPIERVVARAGDIEIEITAAETAKLRENDKVIFFSILCLSCLSVEKNFRKKQPFLSVVFSKFDHPYYITMKTVSNIVPGL